MKHLCTAIFALLLFACNSIGQPEKELEVPAFEKAISANNIQLLDVRTAAEFRSGHIKNSLQADWNDKNQFIERTKYLDKNNPVFVYCLSGARSAAAAEWLRQQGYNSVFELEGGIANWKRQDKPIEGKENVKQMSVADYQSHINSHPTVLVDFGAPWCPPCKKMEPVLNALEAEHGSHYKLVKVDGGNDIEVMKITQVEAIPVFIIYKNGKEVWRKQGIVSKDELKRNL